MVERVDFWFKEVFCLPFKWFGALIAGVALLFASGCSLVVIQGLEQSGYHPDDLEALQEEEAAPVEEDEDLEAQPPVEDEADSAPSEPVEHAVELTASNLTFFVDDSDWAQESYEEIENVQFTQFTPGGRDADYVEKVVRVLAYPDMQTFITPYIVAESTRETFEEEFDGQVDWDVLDQERDHMLVAIRLIDGQTQETVNGLARFLSNDDGIYALVYLTYENWSQEESEKWQGLFNQAGNTDITL